MGERPAFVIGACCLLGAALILSGCGGGGTTPAPGTKKTTVLMMRHCLRDMPEKGIYDVQGLDYFNNYSQTPWAPFLNKEKPVPAFYCLDRGEKIVEEQGEWLKKNGNLPSPITAIADTCQRDDVTAHAFLRGLGVDANSDTFFTNHFPFDNGKNKTLTPDCKTLTAAELFAAISAQRKMTPPPSNYAALVDQIYKVAGKGAAGDWTNTSCTLEADPTVHWWAPFIGGCNVANEFAERFLMEWGGGMAPGWGKLNTTDIPKLLAVHAWYLRTSLFIPSVQKSEAASIAWAILETLEAGAQGTTNFVGHDTQQGGLSAALGLSWDPSPYAESATIPGSMLRFDLDSGSDIVTMSYGFPEDYGKGGDMKFVPASFPGMKMPEGKVSMKDLRDIVTKGTDASCRAYKPGAVAQKELVV